jgi:trehalose 6-phosphate phosphatase
VDGLELLGRLAAEPERAAILLDVDGTLAPIVSRPEDASVPTATREQLARLHRRYALVGCISGRPGADARQLVGVDGLAYVGEHGLELEPQAEAWVARLETFVASVDWPAERKRLTASFHYREHQQPDEARAALEQIALRAESAGFRPRWGRKVLEIRPPIDADKGTAIRHLLRERNLHRALYAGDDTTDLDGFHALDGLDVAVRVAVRSAEGPAELVSAADLVVGDPAELAQVLEEL